MKGKIICSEYDLESICLNGVVAVGETIEIQVHDRSRYSFNKEFDGRCVEGWLIYKEYVEVVEE